MGWGGAAPLFAIKKIERLTAEQSALGRADEPLAAIGIVAGLADGIIRGDEDEQGFGPVVGELVRLFGLEDERVAGFDRRGAILVARGAAAGEHVIEFPLRAVRVIR